MKNRIIERTGAGYRVRPERKHEELIKDLGAIVVMLVGLAAVMLICEGVIKL